MFKEFHYAVLEDDPQLEQRHGPTGDLVDDIYEHAQACAANYYYEEDDRREREPLVFVLFNEDGSERCRLRVSVVGNMHGEPVFDARDL